jgi:hypothetical protein
MAMWKTAMGSKFKVFLILLLSAIMIASMTACSLCYLVIENDSSFSLESVTWFGTSFGSIAAGSSNRQKVQPGTDYVYFAIGGTRMRTAYSLTCEKGYETTYRITDLTPVYVFDTSLSRDGEAELMLLEEAILLIDEN